VIRYHGRIDDQYGNGFRRDQPSRRDLEQALDELLAGKPISTPRTEVSGCLIERSRKPLDGGEVTYGKHVARVLQKTLSGMPPAGRNRPVPIVDL